MVREVQYVEVILPLALPMDTLTYACSDARVRVGVRVRVPLGSKGKMVVGVVCGVGVEIKEGVDITKIKTVDAVLDSVSLVSEKQLTFLRWVAEYYMIGLGQVLKMALTPMFTAGMEGLRSARKSQRSKKRKKNEEKETVVEAVKGCGVFEGDNSERGIVLVRSVGQVDYCGLIEDLFENNSGVVLVLCPNHRAVMAMTQKLNAKGGYSVQVYSNQISTARRAKVLVECAMECGAEKNSPKRVVVGTRAALWLNLKGLKGVLISNEHSYYYRSAAPPFVSGREAALMLATIMKVKCVVESPYPLVESVYNSLYGQWGFKELKGGVSKLRSIVLERGKDMLSSYLRENIAKVLGEGKKVVLLQNRRGVASYVECERCGFTPQCPNCSVSLTLHTKKLGCHYCGYSSEVINNCSQCEGQLKSKGRGTQIIENQLLELFPEARVQRVDSDNIVQEGTGVNSLVRKILGGDNSSWDIIIGTSLVVEQIDWREVGLAGVLNVDNMLSAADFRVDERAYRTLGLMSNFCMCYDAEFVIQSSRLGHRVVDALLYGDFEDFYRGEIVHREAMHFPPHSRMLRFDFRGQSLSNTTSVASVLEDLLRPIFSFRLSPLYQPVVDRQCGDYLVEIMLKVERGRSFSRAKCIVRDGLLGVCGYARRLGVVIFLEVDPW